MLPAQCKYCQKSFRYRSTFKYHVDNVHFSDKQQKLSCHRCQQLFPSHARLQRHERCHQPKQFQCTICGRYFRFKDNLSRHGKTHDTFQTYKYDTLQLQCEILWKELQQRNITLGDVLDPCGAFGSTLQNFLSSRGCLVVCNREFALPKILA
eukprot:Lithocolla_globosa_v1_NODE_7416_length_949_cov_176.475391.p1 type:complete len:152 gc:universal NODE_7416_length_949_cov_176.475391:626-171(-)